MNNALKLLQQRNSAPRLVEPGPDPEALQNMLVAALRVPDHAWLQPWRFIVIQGDQRQALGEVFRASVAQRNPEADATALEKAASAPLRAPLVVAVLCCYQEHPKVPRDEQLISAGCAAHAMLLAAEAQGFAGVWRTGAYAEDEWVDEALGVAANENIVGFLYFGSRDGKAKSLPSREVGEYVSNWKA